jgi:hypothetical protein
MPRDLPAFVERFRDRHGKLRFYIRRGKGPRIRLPADPRSVEFQAAYAEALAGNARPKYKTAGHPAPGTIAALITSYMRGQNYLALRDTTKDGYRRAIEILREQHGHRLVAGLTRDRIEKAVMTPYADRPGQALVLLKMLRILVKHAIDIRMLTLDPTVGIRRPKLGHIRAWTEAEIATFEARWPIVAKQRLRVAPLHRPAPLGCAPHDLGRRAGRRHPRGAAEDRSSPAAGASPSPAAPRTKSCPCSVTRRLPRPNATPARPIRCAWLARPCTSSKDRQGTRFPKSPKTGLGKFPKQQSNQRPKNEAALRWERIGSEYRKLFKKCQAGISSEWRRSDRAAPPCVMAGLRPGHLPGGQDAAALQTSRSLEANRRQTACLSLRHPLLAAPRDGLAARPGSPRPGGRMPLCGGAFRNPSCSCRAHSSVAERRKQFRRSEVRFLSGAPKRLAQWVEQKICTLRVAGSTPASQQASNLSLTTD